jgi:hypothetical protein
MRKEWQSMGTITSVKSKKICFFFPEYEDSPILHYKLNLSHLYSKNMIYEKYVDK